MRAEPLSGPDLESDLVVEVELIVRVGRLTVHALDNLRPESNQSASAVGPVEVPSSRGACTARAGRSAYDALVLARRLLEDEAHRLLHLRGCRRSVTFAQPKTVASEGMYVLAPD